MARSQASMGSAVSLFFALFYSLVYIPSEFASLRKASNSSSSNPDFAHVNKSEISDFVNSGMFDNLVQFYYGRIISRIFLVVLMSFCIGAFFSSRICVPDTLFQSYFQDFIFKELRGLRHRDAVFEMHLMIQLVNDGAIPSSVPHCRKIQSSDEFFFLGAKFKKSTLLPYVVNISNPIFFIVAFIPNRIFRFFFSMRYQRPQPFTSLQHACLQMILYNYYLRRSAKVPAVFMDSFGLCFSRFIPRRLMLLLCDHRAMGLLDDMDSILNMFPIEQRVHLFYSVMCHSNCCTIIVAAVCMLSFVQGALVSDMVVASWFSIPHSQKRISRDDSSFSLFHNYRELINWEYIINNHFMHMLFFNVNLTCTNATMFMVLAPSFVVTAAGFASNQGRSIDLTSIDFWFIVSLAISYFVCYITNALTYSNIFKMFVNRTNDLAFVSDNTMRELSHEFMSLSRITLDAMSTRCATASTLAARRIRCMMWLLRKQQFEVQIFRPDSMRLHNSEVTAAVSIRKLLRQEFEHGDSSLLLETMNFGAWFMALCDICQSRIEFKYEFSENLDVTVRCVESDIRHFLCSFLFSVLLHAFHWSSSVSGSLKIIVRVLLSNTVTLNATMNRKSRTCHKVSTNLSVVTPCPNHAELHSNHIFAVPCDGTDTQYVHFFAELLDLQTSAVLSTDLEEPWFAPFFELENFAIYEFVTRMQGCVQIPQIIGPESELFGGAFALPCSIATVAAAASPTAEIPLRFLIIEDKPMFAAHLIARIKNFPSASNYTFDHECNVSDALAKFSSSGQQVDPLISSADSSASYDIVLIDMFMPMERGAAVNSQAGVRFLFIAFGVYAISLLMRACAGVCSRTSSRDGA
jgi:hypothetical protein